MSQAKPGTAIWNMNVTPLIDVLLVLLIIFMVFAPVRSVGLDAAIPQPASDQRAAPVVDRTIVVQIERGGAVKIDEEAVRMERLADRLAEIFRSRAERVAFVKGDRSLEFQDVAVVIDAIHGAGIERIGLL